MGKKVLRNEDPQGPETRIGAEIDGICPPWPSDFSRNSRYSPGVTTAGFDGIDSVSRLPFTAVIGIYTARWSPSTTWVVAVLRTSSAAWIAEAVGLSTLKEVPSVAAPG